MDKLGSLYGSENSTDSGGFGADKRSNYSMMYSANVESCKLRDSKVMKVEDKILFFRCP